MSSRSLLTHLFLLAITGIGCLAQTCTTGTASPKLVCVVPQVYGVDGLDAATRFGTAAGSFSSNFLANSLRPVESSIARGSALLPLASPSSGFIFTYNSATRVFEQVPDSSFGPIMGERSETIGQHKVFVGISYQYYNFSSLDGLSLKKLNVLQTQPDDSTTLISQDLICSAKSNTPSFDNNTGITTTSFGQCGFIRDVIETANRVDLKIHQFTTFITYGLTDRIDLSLAIPIENVRMGVTSNAMIVHNDSPTRFFHAFEAHPDCIAPCLNRVFHDEGSASGITDITLRAKGTAWKGERAALALGVDVRVPTGDQYDFLGAGAAGVKPFVIWSYRSRISPHTFAGYETNGSSVIGGDITTGKKDKLPGQLAYSGGVDAWITKWLTGAFDIVGQEVFQAQSSSPTQTPDLGQCQDDADICSSAKATPPKSPVLHPDLVSKTSSYNLTNASLGFKFKPLSNLLITGNVLLKLNDGGLRSKVVPLAGISYTF